MKEQLLSDDKPDAEQRMLGAIPGKPALGRGPAADGDYSRHHTIILPLGGALPKRR